jgi:hypothetical protein
MAGTVSDDMEREDGGPAFPRPLSETNNRSVFAEAYSGMALRDWFAGQAMLMLTREWLEQDDTLFEDVAANCYELADAMLEARKR